jgi:hypothetical protein
MIAPPLGALAKLFPLCVGIQHSDLSASVVVSAPLTLDVIR